MAEAEIYRTWPCGMKESLKVKTTALETGKLDLDALPSVFPRCPAHGDKCHRDVGKVLGGVI